MGVLLASVLHLARGCLTTDNHLESSLLLVQLFRHAQEEVFQGVNSRLKSDWYYRGRETCDWRAGVSGMLRSAGMQICALPL